MQELDKILEEMQEVKEIMLSPQNIDCFGDPCKENDCCACVINKCMEIVKKHMNDDWIPVEEALPEDDVDVLVTYADIDDENYTDICITTYGYAYLGGNKLDFKEWRSPFEYFKTNYKVIAWRPLPEPYRPERSE